MCGHAQSPHFTHTYINTPFRYLLWSKLSHLVKQQKFEQEASKQRSKNSQTQWYIVVFCVHVVICVTVLSCVSNALSVLHVTLFHLKSESWDVRYVSVPDVEQDAWLFFVSEDRNKTLHSGSCYVPARHCEIYIFFSLCSVYSFKASEKVLNASLINISIGSLSLTFETVHNCSFFFLLCFQKNHYYPFLFDLPRFSANNLFPCLSGLKWGRVRSLPASQSLYLLFPSSPPSPSPSTPFIPP